jgi:hypothetical protein
MSGTSGDFRSEMALNNTYTIFNAGAEYRLVTQRWHHIGFTFKASTGVWELYRDGLLAATTTNVAAVSYGTGGALTIGSLYNSTRFFNGIVDDVRVCSVIQPATWWANQYNIGKRLQGRPAR